jgi:N6-L-threonylcarbamoyladenine synthase
MGHARHLSLGAIDLIILGIETSCDDSAAAVVEDGRLVRSSLVSSQIETHAKFGGVVPEIAAREHLKILSPLVKESLLKAELNIQEIDAIAVTQGPGLIGSLLIGVTFAKGLAYSVKKPLIPVDHVHGHVHGALLSMAEQSHDVSFPAIALVASGGHCNLYYMSSPIDFELLAWTADDACGECFDKVAKKLGFSYPGGPLIESKAAKGAENTFKMPRMVEKKDRLEFSYSGLKTHMVNLIHKQDNPIEEKVMNDLCAGFQKEALGQLVRKLQAATKIRPDARSIIVAGGVAANQYFRKSLSDKVKNVACYFPNLKYCSDNAAMIAAYGFHLQKNKEPLPLIDEWDAYSRYNFRKHIKPS